MKLTSSIITLFLLCVLLAGCGRKASVAETDSGIPAASVVESDFDIPPSLVDRMRNSYNIVRNKKLGLTNLLDGEEMMALLQLGYENGAAIAERPRGEMVFSDDGQTEEERRRIWPFDVEAFEATLKASLVQDEDGLYQLKEEDGELSAFNPTMRWLNAKMEEWAVKQLDAVFTRVKPDVYAKMTGESPKEDEEIMTWALSEDGDEFFSIEENDGAWNLRSYQFIIWDGKDSPLLFAEFNSFPSRKEAVAMRMARQDCRSLNNLAVLYWRHRVFQTSFNPGEIKDLLEIAQRNNVACAKANLEVLYSHIPELKQQQQ